MDKGNVKSLLWVFLKRLVLAVELRVASFGDRTGEGSKWFAVDG